MQWIDAFEPAVRQQHAFGRTAGLRRHSQRGMVLFMSLVLLLVLTVLGISLARQQTVEERLAQNDYNHELALQTSQAALSAAFDAVGGPLSGPPVVSYTNGSPGLRTLAMEENVPGTPTIDRTASWGSPGTDTLLYGNYGATLAAAPAAAHPQFVVEDMPAIAPPGCGSANASVYGSAGNGLKVRRITAHAAGGDGTASATVQIVRVQGC